MMNLWFDALNSGGDLVILQFGQSNSSGWVYDYVNNGGYDLNNERFKIFYKPIVSGLDNGNFETFNLETGNNLNPINKPTSKSHGSEFSLCNELINELEKKIHVIKLSGGSISLDASTVYDSGYGTWYPDDVGVLPYYRWLIDWYIKPALVKLNQPRIIAVIFHQGESDTKNDDAASNYATNLDLLFSTLAEVNISIAQKYICRIGSWWNFAINDNLNIVRTAQENYCAANDNFNLIDTDDLTNDGGHLYMAAQEIKGLRIYNDLITKI